MSLLPTEFIGLWERIAIVVDGQPIRDAGRSLWFQAETQFLDVRAAGGGLLTEMFGGRTTWDPATESLSWSHDIDLHPDSRDDTGRVEWRDGDLIEYGTAPGLTEIVDYHEVWRRRQGGEPVVIADRVDGVGRLARCGDRGAVFLDDRPTGTPAGGLFTDRRWQWVFDVTICRALPCRPAALPPDGSQTFAQFGATWRIVTN